MGLKSLLLALAIGSATTGVPVGGQPAGGRAPKVRLGSTLHDFPRCSVRLLLPSGWAAFEADYSVMHYRDVFLCVNNIGSRELRVEGAASDDRLPRWLGAYNPEVVAEQLPPGAVYLDFGFWGRPGVGQHFSSRTRDNFESSVRSISPTHSKTLWKTPQLTAYNIGFVKWGWGWSVFVYFREPVSPADKQAAFEVIKNIVFVDLPITSEIRAATAAFESLPEAVRDSLMGEAEECECCDRGVYPQVESSGADFRVMLELGKKRWTYLVSRGGSVRLIARSED